MAHNEELSSKSIMHSVKVLKNFHETMLHIELIPDKFGINPNVMRLEKEQEYFNTSVLTEMPDEKNCGNESYKSECSSLLSSTSHYDDEECKQSEVSMQSSNSGDGSDPSTSTPQREIQTAIRKYKARRPPDLVIHEASGENDYNINVDVNQCSPVRSPFPGLDDSLDLDNSFVDLDDTIEPPHYDTPPTGLELDKRARKMVYLLKRYGLTHFAFIFIEQEIDLDLFLTLTDSDLQEIGIQRKRDRNSILSMIEECNFRN